MRGPAISLIFSPTLLPGEALVQEGQHFSHVELNVLEIEIFLLVFLHHKQIIELQVEFEKSPMAPCAIVSGRAL